MSAGEDNIFSRWSRRKQAERHDKAPAPGEEQAAPEAVDFDVGSADRQPPEEEHEADEPLPSLDDLTAQSDLSAFLRKGVPDALKSAALRKMWSLDPAIRDYIGPSENAWDFNQPGSMAGFGPLDAKEAVVDFLSKLGDGEKPGPASRTAEMPASSPQQIAEVSPEHDASASSEGTDEAVPLPDNAAGVEQPSDTSADTATGTARTGKSSHPAAPRRHGGAMPR